MKYFNVAAVVVSLVPAYASLTSLFQHFDRKETVTAEHIGAVGCLLGCSFKPTYVLRVGFKCLSVNELMLSFV